MRSIRRQLLIWLIAGTLAATLVAGVALYLTVQEEANELFDSQLQRIADSLPVQISAQPNQADDDPEEDVVAQVWDDRGALIYSSRPSQPLPRFPGTGLTNAAVMNERWHVYSENRYDRFIQVAQATSARDELVFGSALRSLLPFLVLIPALAVLIGVVVGRGLQPLRQIAEAVGRRSPTAMQPLSTAGIPPDIRPMVDAINDLLARLDRALDAQRSFIADAAHELRSPLAALKLQLQLAERAGNDEQRAAAFIKLHARLDRSTHLIRQLLTLARYEPQMAEQAFEPLDLGELAQQVVADHDALAESKGIDLGAEINTPLRFQGHKESLRIMLGNLIDNALGSTPKGGRVDVIASTRDGHPMLKVVDNGPGISADERPKVFERFFRGEGAKAPGSGLGLAIVKNVADHHGAAVSLGDNPLGRGLVVTVSFPARRAAAA